jgi:hypothetical protein
MLPGPPHATKRDLVGAVIDSLVCCEADIRNFGAQISFWDRVDGALRPRDEPTISRIVASYLHRYAAARNFEVICDPVTGSGRVDFYISAPIVGLRGPGRLAIEAKKAHSDDLEHGFTHQLPAYMRRLETDIGIYLVYWMKSADFQRPRFENYGALELQILNPLARTVGTRTMGFDISIEPHPSRS